MALYCTADLVGWDESAAGERQPRVSLWEIEPLTTFPMYPSLFPLRLKRPWHPGVSSVHDNRDDASNGLMWLRGGVGDQGLHSLNLQSMGSLPWLQQRLDSPMFGNDHNQQYQAMLAAGMPNLGGVDMLRQQIMHLQQPFQYIQQAGFHNSLLQQQQQLVQQSMPQNILQTPSQVMAENIPQHILQQTPQNQSEDIPNQQQRTYHDTLQVQSNQFHQGENSNVPSPPFPRTELMDSNTNYSESMISRRNILASSCAEGTGNLSNIYRSGQSILTEQLPQQSPVSKNAHPQVDAHSNSMTFPPPFSGRDSILELGNCNSDSPSRTLFGVNIDSSGLLLPSNVPTYASPSIGPDSSSMPMGDSGFQNSMYSCVQDSSELLHSSGQVDPLNPTRTFVKVYKSGSVGRSLDISRFSSYQELREELAQMFGIEGQLVDPHRSGWQLVFVDRENDVLLLGDDPWEAFVNNVWYIKILSPQDFQKLGVQAIESFNPVGGQRLTSGGNEAENVSGLPSVGSLEY